MKPVAIVTGGSRGIGRATAIELVDAGYLVYSLGRSRPTTAHPDVRDEIADVTSARRMDEILHAVGREHGTIDALVTSAAILHSAPLHETTLEIWDHVVRTNLTGVFLACKGVLPYMQRAGHGAIVNLSSVHAQATVKGAGAYAATKGAIIALSRQLAVEYADANIRVNSLVVGSVDTAMSASHGELLKESGVSIRVPEGRLGRMADPTEIAKTVRFLLGEDSSFISGAAVTVDGGLTSLLM